MLREDAESLIRTDDTTVPLLAKDKTRTAGSGPMCAGPIHLL